MKINKRIATTMITATLALGMVTPAFADDNQLHLMWGTEDTYGEMSNQKVPLYGDEDSDYLSGSYTILPKNEYFYFEQSGSNVDPSHDIEITIACPKSSTIDGHPALFWEVDMMVRSEKFEYEKKYSLYDEQMKAKLTELNAMYQHEGGYGYMDNPFVVIYVYDTDLQWAWQWLVQLIRRMASTR